MAIKILNEETLKKTFKMKCNYCGCIFEYEDESDLSQFDFFVNTPKLEIY